MSFAKDLIISYEGQLLVIEDFYQENKIVIDRFQLLNTMLAEFETALKVAVKEEEATVEGDKFIAQYQVRHSASVIKWNLPEIEKNSWASAVITKTVDEKTFKALTKIGKIENPEQYFEETPGKEIKAVYIIKKEVK